MPTHLFEMLRSTITELSASSILLRLALATCSMFATVHLFSLWGTRYGDRHTMAKSFFLSLVMHGVFCLGWATVAESYPRGPSGGDVETVQTPISFVEVADVAPIQGTSKLPIFHSGPSSPGSPLTRDSRLTRRERDDQLVDIEVPELDKSPEVAVAPEVPEFVAPTEDQAPDLERAESNSAKPVASSPMGIEQPAQESNPEFSPKTTVSRGSITRSQASDEPAPRREIKRGGSTRTTPDVEDGAIMSLPYDTAQDASPRPQGTTNNEVIQRQGSPRPAMVDDPVAGSGPDGSGKVAGPRRPDRASRPAARPGDVRDEVVLRPSTTSNPSAMIKPLDERLSPGRETTFDTQDEPSVPSVVRPVAPMMSRAPARAPETYQARTSGQRMSIALKNGGSEESEQAVENSLKWMASVQEADGRWSAARHGGGSVETDPEGRARPDGGKYADPGVTGLVVLSFLGAGYTHERGPYTSEIRKALDWLIAQQGKDGYLAMNAARYDKNYCHAIATFALAEAYAMQKDAADYPELRAAVNRGLRKIHEMQNGDGGWRYGQGGTGDESDMSMFGWQLMAVKSGVNAGIPIPRKTTQGMVQFLQSRERGKSGGLAGYRKDDPPTPAMTAEALFCRQMFLSGRGDDPAGQEAVAYLRRHLPKVTEYDEYFWYYGTLAMHNLDGQSWKEWNSSLRDMLISLQHQDGPLAGSWDPRGKWAGIGGRLYATALSTMCLEVYYRYQSTSKNSGNQ